MLLYYNINLTEKQKNNNPFFFFFPLSYSMGLNWDGSLSVSECMESLNKVGFKSCFLMELDKNGDGMLDFEEVYEFIFYLAKSERLIFCDGHGWAFLDDLYFICHSCFRHEKITFDLCSLCFNHNNYSNNHATFLDNIKLLI